MFFGFLRVHATAIGQSKGFIFSFRSLFVIRCQVNSKFGWTWWYKLSHTAVLFVTGAISPPPCDLPEGVLETIAECLNAVRSYYHLLRDDQIRKWWADWERVYSPRSEDKLEYVEQLKRANIAYHVPLRTVLFNPAVFCSTTDWSNSSALFANTVPFRYPEITAVATNSVRSSFNLHPPEPRLYTVEDEQLADDVGRFVRDTTVYYDVTLKALTAQALKYIIRHKVPMTGVVITSTGTKPIIINHIRDADK